MRASSRSNGGFCSSRPRAAFLWTFRSADYSAEDLLVLKAFAGRVQDWLDIEGVIVAPVIHELRRVYKARPALLDIILIVLGSGLRA